MDTSFLTMVDLAWWTPWRLVGAIVFIGFTVSFIRSCWSGW